MSKITNTARDDIHPEYLFGGNPSAIEEQEAKGQKELEESQQLPIQCGYKDKKKLEQAGVVFGKPLKDDPLFCEAVLPNGWKVEKTDHSMWSNLVDEKGKQRAGIFYKAAFYDREAFITAS